MPIEILYKEEAFKIIGICMEVHRELGLGFHEFIYQEALEIEFKLQGIPFVREQEYKVFYKGKQLSKTFKADFVVFDKIVLEIKAKSEIIEEHEIQTLNYLACSKLKLGIIANFGAKSFQQKRIIR